MGCFKMFTTLNLNNNNAYIYQTTIIPLPLMLKCEKDNLYEAFAHDLENTDFLSAVLS